MSSDGAKIAAIERKTSASYVTLADRGQLMFWQDAYKGFDRKLREAAFVVPCSTMMAPSSMRVRRLRRQPKTSCKP